MMIDAYIRLVIIFIVTVIILYLPILFILKKKNIGIIRQLSYLSLFFSAFFVVFLAIILFNIPFDFKPEQHVFNPIPFGRFDEKDVSVLKTITTEIIPNIIMFIPLGIFIPVVFKKMRKIYNATLIIFFITFSIEFFQYFIGRKSDIDDIITNLLGGLIGYGIFQVFNHLFKDKKWWHKFIGKDLTI